MIADAFQNNGSGKLTQGIEQDSTIRSVVQFIEVNFAEFSMKVKGEITTSEKALTDKLCKFLNRKASGFPFFFQHENVESHASGNSPQIDIGAVSENERLTIGDRYYGEFDCFFSIEAKRLPTPGHNRKKEYVIGKGKPCGGIERFKKRIHGNNLRYAAVIGYVQKEDLDYWFLEINNWINELILLFPEFWKEEDKLVNNEDILIGLGKYMSKNYRLGINGQEDFIHLYHFWINLIDS